MKRFILLIIFLIPFALLAQDGGDRIHKFRIGVFTRVLNLTTEEAEQFWPVYNDFLSKREKLQQDFKPGKGLDLMNDAEVEDLLKRHFEFKQRELDLEKETYQKLRQVLPSRKIAKLELAERRFREEIVQRIKDRPAQQNAGLRRRNR